MLVAKDFNKMPHEWDLMPKRSKAEMMAALEVDHLMYRFQLDNPIGDSS